MNDILQEDDTPLSWKAHLHLYYILYVNFNHYIPNLPNNVSVSFFNKIAFTCVGERNAFRDRGS